MIDDNYDILHDLGWWYKPYYISKTSEKVSFLPDDIELNFYDAEFLPPDNQLN